MQIAVKGKNIEVGEPLRSYIEKKMNKIQRYFEKDITGAQVTLKMEKGINTVDAIIQVDGLLLRGEARTGDIRASIDDAVDKIERQIRKYKTRINRRLRQAGNKIIEAELETGGVPEENGEAVIVRTKRFAMKPMSVEEAVMQMELIGHDFFVFSNADTEEVNVVYRRKDGNYGLIEPEF